jgi:hypothetical protein
MNRYGEINRDSTQEGRSYIDNPIYPEIPLSEDDIYVITTAGDRYDTLSLQFYGDPAFWWIIASANTSTRSSLNVEKGIQLRIPASKEQALQIYNEVNLNR